QAPPTASPGLLHALGQLRAALLAEEAADPPPDPDDPAPSDLATALLGWAAAHPSLVALSAAIVERRRLLAELRREDAALSLATAHGTKGLEWEHVLVLTDGFPGRRSVSDAAEPERALEEERRLAYVAWTRARRSLTLLYDPEAISPFLREAFDPLELAPPTRGRAA
ncbi:MAG TPA: 3'-5' exonuclease, partial [Candidatus Limnocylindrales bacterium]|nr:3'-5' exonuclease [Candidatus Limnocylindrales bacterium]